MITIGNTTLNEKAIAKLTREQFDAMFSHHTFDLDKVWAMTERFRETPKEEKSYKPKSNKRKKFSKFEK